MNLRARKLIDTNVFPFLPIERLLLFLLLALLCTPVIAQEKISFHDVSEGLSQGTVTSIVQDNYGFLWIGTQYGLNKFDGKDYIQYHHIEQDDNSLMQNNITALAIDDKNNLWIGHSSGIDKLDLKTGNFSHYNVDNNKLSNNYVTDLYIDEDQLLWIGTEKGGINVIDTKTGAKKSKVAHLNLEQLKHGNITTLSGNDEFILAGTWSDGLLILNPSQGTVLKESNIKHPIRAIKKSSQESFIIATNEGVYTNTPGVSPSQKYSYANPILENSVILSIHINKDGSQYFGTENNGLFHKTTDGKLIQYSTKNNNSSNQISGNSIWDIFEDDRGIIWLGLYLKGLNKIDELEEMFKKIQYNKNGNQLDLVSAIEESSDNKLWLGTDGNGLFSFNLQTNQFDTYENVWGASSEKVVTALLFDSNENLWIGTWQDGVKILYPKTKQVKSLYFDKTKTQTSCISGNYIHCIFEDNYNNFWITSFHDGLDILDQNGNKIKTISKEEIISLKIRTLTQDCDQNIILGTELSGIQILKVDKDYNILSTNSFFDKEVNQGFGHSINDLFIDKDCNLWIGSNGGLIFKKYGEENFKVYTTKDGLPSNMISSIEQDKFGLIWASTNQGIFSFDKTNEVFKHFNSHDGLLSNEFLQEASLQSRSGKIFFGNTAGVNYFTPDSIKTNTKISPIYITNVLVSGRNIERIDSTKKSMIYNDQEIVLQHDQNDLSFEFTSLNVTQAEQNQFRFRLEGTDDHWQYGTDEKSVNYRDLKPGKYRFEVMGSNNDQIWNPTPASFSFRIKKPFYNTYWAWLIYVLTIASILYFFIRNLLLRERLQADLELEHLQLQQFKKIDQIKSQFFANISHEFMTPLTMIISPLKGIRNKSSMRSEWSTIDIMIKHAERLEKYIRQILDLSKLDSGTVKLKIDQYEFNSFLNSLIDAFQNVVTKDNIHLVRNIPTEATYLYFDPDKLERVFLNLLSNAFKYTEKGGTVSIDVVPYDSYVKVQIRDTGSGIAPDHIPFIFDRFYREKDESKISGTGLGLSISKQLVELLKGKIEVESEEQVGTCFTITLQKGKDHFAQNELSETSSNGVHLVDTTKILKDQATTVQAIPKNGIEHKDLPIVLVVEDNPDIQNFIKATLNADYDVILADDGQIGYDLAKQTIPDIIITDVMMPNLDGYGLCKKLRADLLTSHIAIIMLTVKSSEENQKTGLELGVDHYLSKPFNPELLKLRIKNILSYRKKIASSVFKPKATALEVDYKQLGLNPMDEKFLKKLKNIVLDNISDSNFSNRNLELEMGVSKSQLYRKLKALTGLSANVYIRRVRLEEAAKLIKEGELNISEITYKVGFNDLQYFRTCFKKQYGSNPSSFLKQSKEVE